MSDKPDLTLIKTEPIDKLPMESLDDFKQWVLVERLKPSVALRRFMDKYNCPHIHDTTVISLLTLTYPDIDIADGGLRFNVVDSGYPNSNPDDFSDEDLDKGIEQLLKHLADR